MTTVSLNGIADALRAWGIGAYVAGIGGNVRAVHVGRRTLTINDGVMYDDAPVKLDVWFHAARAGESDMATETTEVASADEAVAFLLAVPKSPEELAEAADRDLRATETPTERTMLAAFLDAALWAGVSDEHGEEVDVSEFGHDDVQADPATWVKVRTMIRAFLVDLDTMPGAFDPVRAKARDIVQEDPSQAGHDLWLTMQHHGVGFWDRGNGEAGDLLTELADRLGSEDAHIWIETEHDGTRTPRLDFP